MRSLTSYFKVQKFISFFLRRINHRFIYCGEKKYLDLGCGNNISDQFLNIDYIWMPGVDICLDISKTNIPVKSNSLKGIYTEHCLEHIPYCEIPRILSEFYRTLEKDGRLRIIVPDGQIYIEAYNNFHQQNINVFPYYGDSLSPMERINGIFRNHGHLFIYDFHTFKILLEQAGFKQVKKTKFMEGEDSNLLKDTEWRNVESLYLEAVK